MSEKLKVKTRGCLARAADAVLHPAMALLSGAPKESPQRTHPWNNTKLHSPELVQVFDHRDRVLSYEGKGEGSKQFRFPLPLFHMPVFGGWKDYVVLQPAKDDTPWHAGWMSADTANLSHFRLRGPVRLLLGPGQVVFFGVDAAGELLSLEEVGRGRIGDGGPHHKVPLL